jgi:hypothetical protein
MCFLATANFVGSGVLGADAYTALAETSDQGYPVLDHVKRLVKDQIIWAPAITGALVLTTRGGDFDLRIGEGVFIGYLTTTTMPRSVCTCRRHSLSSCSPPRPPSRWFLPPKRRRFDTMETIPRDRFDSNPGH